MKRRSFLQGALALLTGRAVPAVPPAAFSGAAIIGVDLGGPDRTAFWYPVPSGERFGHSVLDDEKVRTAQRELNEILRRQVDAMDTRMEAVMTCSRAYSIAPCLGCFYEPGTMSLNCRGRVG